MRLRGKAYDERLEKYSYTTINLISLANASTKEIALKASEITTDSTLSEEEVRTKLIELLNNKGTK